MEKLSFWWPWWGSRSTVRLRTTITFTFTFPLHATWQHSPTNHLCRPLRYVPHSTSFMPHFLSLPSFSMLYWVLPRFRYPSGAHRRGKLFDVQEGCHGNGRTLCSKLLNCPVWTEIDIHICRQFLEALLCGWSNQSIWEILVLMPAHMQGGNKGPSMMVCMKLNSSVPDSVHNGSSWCVK